MTTLPTMFKPSSHDEFIGPAAREARSIERLIDTSRKAGRAPIKVLILGKPGIGKSSLSNFFVRCIGADKWSSHRFNGVEAKIEQIEDLATKIHYTNLFGDYRVIQFEEIDAMPRVAQIRALTLIDDLPPGNAVVATSNCSLNDLEERFQTRFQVIQLKAPTAEEITALLSGKWEITTKIATQIATLACGNVRQALLDAQSYLTA